MKELLQLGTAYGVILADLRHGHMFVNMAPQILDNLPQQFIAVPVKHRMWEVLAGYRGKLGSMVPPQQADQKHLQRERDDLFAAELRVWQPLQITVIGIV